MLKGIRQRKASVEICIMKAMHVSQLAAPQMNVAELVVPHMHVAQLVVPQMNVAQLDAESAVEAAIHAFELIERGQWGVRRKVTRNLVQGN